MLLNILNGHLEISDLSAVEGLAFLNIKSYS